MRDWLEFSNKLLVKVIFFNSVDKKMVQKLVGGIKVILFHVVQMLVSF